MRSLVRTDRLLADISLDREELDKVLRRLVHAGWVPAAQQARAEFYRLAGMESPDSPRRVTSVYGSEVAGDVFFRDQDVYYCTTKISGESNVFLSNVTTVSGESEESTGAQLELGLISEQADGGEERLASFAEAFKAAALASLDGRRTRHMRFVWTRPTGRTARLDELRKRQGDSVRFESGSVSAEGLEGARILSTPSARELLQTLSRAGFARERDVLSAKLKSSEDALKSSEDAQKSLEELKRANLVKTEYLLECRRTNRPLTRLANKDALDAAGGLICPNCSQPFKDESISEGYSISKLGSQLTQNSRWMTVWVTDLLINLGVPSDSILWNVTEGSEEIDIVADVAGNLWIFELKDREFGAGDAYPFNYRRARYEPQMAFVITTGIVSPDAKRVLEEQYGDRRASVSAFRKKDDNLRLIEGLAAANEALEIEVLMAAIRYADSRLSRLSPFTGYDLTTVLATRFGYKVSQG